MPYDKNLLGWMREVELKVLEFLAQRVPKEGTIVEVGSYKGRSSWALANSCDPSVNIVCIDIWKDPAIKESFIENTKDCLNLEYIQSGSTEVDWPEDKKVDLVFIDADHTSPQVDRDLEFWSRRVKKDGTLAGHDFNAFRWPDVCRAVLNTCEELQLPFKLYGREFIWWIDYDPGKSPDFGWEPNEVVMDWIKELVYREL